MKFLLVGSFATKGAAAVIAKGLPQHAEVRLVAEPGNPYDPLAVKVYVARGVLRDSEALAEALAGSGLSEATLWSEDGVLWEGEHGADPLFPLGHLGAKYETKAAKAALREGWQFRLAREWHGGGGEGGARVGEAPPARGKLIQCADGTKLIET